MGYYIFFITWITLTFIWAFSFGVAGYKNNQADGYGKWFWISFFLSFFPIWSIVSKNSRNVAFDAILMDILVVIGTAISLYYIGAMHSFSQYQYLGIVMMIFGIIIFHFK